VLCGAAVYNAAASLYRRFDLDTDGPGNIAVAGIGEITPLAVPFATGAALIAVIALWAAL